MAVTPIKARCRRCDGLVFLRDVAVEKTGVCSWCHMPFSPDWTHHLREHAANAERAQRELVNSLNRLRSLPGNLELIPASVLDNVIGEVGWERALVENAELLHRETENLHRWARQWERLQSRKRSKRRSSGRRRRPTTTARENKELRDVVSVGRDLGRV